MSSTITETPTLERWMADPSRTTIEFEVAHLWGLHTVRGRFRTFDGVYFVGPAGTEIRLTIDAASVDTGNAARDKHLRSADFLDVAEHPRVRFTSTHVTGLGNGRVHINGEVQAAGRTVPVAFDGSVRVIDGELELEASTTLDQRRFGMRQGPLSQRPVADGGTGEDTLGAPARISLESPPRRCRRGQSARRNCADASIGREAVRERPPRQRPHA